MTIRLNSELVVHTFTFKKYQSKSTDNKKHCFEYTMGLIMSLYASNFYEIPDALSKNQALREYMATLIKNNIIIAKSLDGEDRLNKFRNILIDFTEGKLDLEKAIKDVATKLPKQNSTNANNNRVFSEKWEERLVRVQFSRFYNQAVLESEKKKGKLECYIPVSIFENSDSECSKQLADTQQNIELLLSSLIDSYERGNFKNKLPKIPDHPNCTHVIKPLN